MKSAAAPAVASSVAKAAKGLWDNPMGTDGFEFVEYAAPDPRALGALFERMGFHAVARHRQKDVTLYKQGDVNFIINAEPGSFGQNFARRHGPSVCAMAFRVKGKQRVCGAAPTPVGLGASALDRERKRRGSGTPV